LPQRLALLVDLEVRALQMLHDALAELPAGSGGMVAQAAPQQLPAPREREPDADTSWLRKDSMGRA
jgi:hypothetical protein